MNYYAISHDDYLVHYGVKGMKWGVIRDRFNTYYKPAIKTLGKTAKYMYGKARNQRGTYSLKLRGLRNRSADMEVLLKRAGKTLMGKTKEQVEKTRLMGRMYIRHMGLKTGVKQLMSLRNEELTRRRDYTKMVEDHIKKNTYGAVSHLTRMDKIKALSQNKDPFMYAFRNYVSGEKWHTIAKDMGLKVPKYWWRDS